MRYRPLGRSGIDVSELALGANNFGGRLDLRQSIAVIHAALDAGINLIDTADVYNAGRSEEFVGRALRGRRDGVVVSTKCGMPSEEGAHAGGLTARHLRWSVEQSLRRLDIAHLDLLQLHIADESTPIGDTLATLQDLMSAGTVRAVGCSNFWAWEVAEAVVLADAAGLPRLASASVEWSLLHREPERELLPAARRLGVGLLPYRPLAQGFLTGKYRRGEAPPTGSRLRLVPAQAELRLSADNFELLQRVETIAEAHASDTTAMALGYLLDHAEVAAVVVGASEPAQVGQLLAAAATWPDVSVAVAEVRRALPPLGGHLLGVPDIRRAVSGGGRAP